MVIDRKADESEQTSMHIFNNKHKSISKKNNIYTPDTVDLLIGRIDNGRCKWTI